VGRKVLAYHSPSLGPLRFQLELGGQEGNLAASEFSHRERGPNPLSR